MTNLSIYTTEVTPRIRYACQFIFIRVLKIKGFELTTNKVEFEAKKQVCKLNYSLESIPNIPFVRPHGLLNETTIRKQVISPQKRKEKHFFFETDLNGVLPFDIFSFVFSKIISLIARISAQITNIRFFPGVCSCVSFQAIL